MFKKGDYIVCLEGNFKTPNEANVSKCARKNYIVKQRVTKSYLMVEQGIDVPFEEGRNNLQMTFDKSQWLTDWRYATPEEIEEYDKLGKPYDVTTMYNLF